MTSKSINVLLIEDDVSDALIIKEYLIEKPSKIKFTITHATNLKDSIEILQTKSSDVILLDLLLPDSDWKTSIPRIKQTAPDVPIIIQTGLDSKDIENLTRNETSVDSYIVKENINQEVLIQAINSAIKEKKERKEKIKKNIQEPTKFISFLEQENDGMVIIDKFKAIQYLNPSAERMFGEKKEKLIGKSFSFDICENKITTKVQELENNRKKVLGFNSENIKWNGENAQLVLIREISLFG